MKYYLHDSNSFQDEKITELYILFGYEGLGLFYTILEKLALQEKPVKTDVLKKQLNIGKRLEKCWKFIESLELISSNNGETFSKTLLNFSEKYQIKKEKNRKRISEWRKNQDVEKNVTCNERVRNSPKVNRSKVNRSKEIVLYLNDKTSKSFMLTSKKTNSLIDARLNEGFTIDNFKKVIDNKCKDWLTDEKMAQYLRPETLFGNKFEGYLNEITINKKDNKEIFNNIVKTIENE